MLFLTVISTIAWMPEAIAATKKQVVCLNSKGKISVRVSKCKKKESKLSLASLASNAVSLATDQGLKGPQGPQGPKGSTGPKGDTGAVGAAGNPAGFDVGGCYYRNSPSQIFDFAADSIGTRQLSCNYSSGQQDFMLSSSYLTLPPTNQTKPFVYSKSLLFDATDSYPVGVSYSSRQAVIIGAVGHQLGLSIVCCPR